MITVCEETARWTKAKVNFGRIGSEDDWCSFDAMIYASWENWECRSQAGIYSYNRGME